MNSVEVTLDTSTATVPEANVESRYNDRTAPFLVPLPVDWRTDMDILKQKQSCN